MVLGLIPGQIGNHSREVRRRKRVGLRGEAQHAQKWRESAEGTITLSDPLIVYPIYATQNIHETCLRRLVGIKYR